MFGLGKRTTRELVLAVSEKGISGVRKDISGLSSETNKLDRLVAGLGKTTTIAGAAIAAGLAAGTAAAIKVGSSLVSTGSQLEKYRVQLNTVLRDTELAGQKLDYLVSFGKKTPFELPGLIEASIQLESFGFNTEAVMDAVGDSAAAMNKDIQAAALALTQGMMGELEMLKQFTITANDIERQIGHRINRATVEGQREVAEAILQIMRDRFGGGMIEMSKTWQGMISNMSDYWFNFRATLAQGGFFDSIKGDLKSLLDALDDFAEKGGVQAISLGFNNAWKEIHRAFFAPLFDSIGDTDRDMRLLAINTERVLLEVAGAAGQAGAALTGLAVPVAFLIDLTAEGDLVYTKKAWEFAKNNIDTASEKVDQLTSRIEGLKLAALALDGEGAMALQDFARAAGVLESSGALGIRPSLDTGPPAGPAETFRGGQGGGAANPFQAITEQEMAALAQIRAVRHDANAERIENEIVWADTHEMYLQDAIEKEWLFASLSREVFASLYKYKYEFARRGAALDKVAAQFAKAAIGEYGKAVIDALVAEARVKAAMATADSIRFAAMGDLRGAGMMLAAGAKYIAVTGIAEVGKALIDRAIAPTEGPTFDQMANDETTTRGVRSSAGGVSRTERAVQNFYITINNNIAGDYNVTEGDLTDAQQIQAMFDQGLITVN